jgi:shikimate kinase
MKIFLIGFMGSGKSVSGRKLASSLGLSFADLDTLIEQNYKMTIPGIFSQFDETVFRKLESKVLKEFIEGDNFVLSCGGGTPCFNNNMELIKESGISIYIKLSPKALADRLLKSKTKRPLIQNIEPEQLVPRIEEMLLIREKFYSQSDITVEGLNLKVGDIIELITALNYTGKK